MATLKMGSAEENSQRQASSDAGEKFATTNTVYDDTDMHRMGKTQLLKVRAEHAPSVSTDAKTHITALIPFNRCSRLDLRRDGQPTCTCRQSNALMSDRVPG